jgi:serine/threonine protein phosphatase PrpC
MSINEELELESVNEKLELESVNEELELESVNEYANTYKISYGVDTDIGNNFENQDNYLIWISDDNNTKLWCIFDGHGDYGKYITNIAKDTIKNYMINNYNEFLENKNQYFKDLFEFTNLKIKELLKNEIDNVSESIDGYLISNNKIIDGGTTCSILIISGNKCYSVNVGDSTLLVFSNNKFKELSGNHSPENIEEYKRIINNYTNPVKFYYDYNRSFVQEDIYITDPITKGIKITKKGAYYKNVRNEFGAYVSINTFYRNNIRLSMTRSLGDYVFKNNGVTYEPNFIEFSLDNLFDEMNNNILCFVIATDGLWDNWQYEDVLNFVMNKSYLDIINNKGGVDRIATALIDKNNLLAQKNFPNCADNATAIVIYISKL